MSHRYRPIPVLGLLLFAACEGPAEIALTPPEILSVRIDSTAGPLIRVATVRLDRPGTVVLTYGATNTPVLAMSADSLRLVHTVILPRLRASKSYRLEVVAAARSRSSSPSTVNFTTGPLPANVAPITFTVTGTPTRPFAIVEVVTGTAMLGMLVVEDGEIVGYSPSVGSLFGTARRQNGDIVLLDPSLGLVARRFDGTQTHRLPQPDSAPGAAYGRIHHDVIATPANTILFVANETRNIAGQNVIGEALWDWNPETNIVVRKWSAFDHLNWNTERGTRSDPANWLHGNGLAYGTRGNVLFSMRNMDQVLSIAPDFSRVEWRLGGPGATLQLANDDKFYGQHGISETASGRLLLFDNGFDRPGVTTPFSRAIEYSIDVAAGTATRIWQYRRSPDMYAALVGSARRVENGNTVILFGMFQGHNGSTGPVMAVEVDAAGIERWRLAPNAAASRLYRLTPLNSLLGETIGTFNNP